MSLTEEEGDTLSVERMNGADTEEWANWGRWDRRLKKEISKAEGTNGFLILSVLFLEVFLFQIHDQVLPLSRHKSAAMGVFVCC